MLYNNSMKQTFYKKVGRKYVAVAEYDDQLMNSFPEGCHIIICHPGGQIRRYKINPDYAAMIAAGTVAEDAISAKIVEATDCRPSRSPLTEEQRKAWRALSKAFGEENHALQWPSAREACQEAVKAMQKEADKLLSNPVVRKAYDHFILMCKLTQENTKNG